MSLYEAAEYDQLIKSWSVYYSKAMDATEDWNREGQTIAQRALKLVLNDPYAAALQRAINTNVLGSGINFSSLFQLDASPNLSGDELATRKAINNAVKQHSMCGRLDPSGQLSRNEIERQLLVSGFVTGNGFAVRTWNPNRPGCAGFGTCWRVIDSSRVGNPKGVKNEPGALINGIEMRGGVPYRLHYLGADNASWESALWRDDQGYLSVIHYAPDLSRAGAVLGFSAYAPLLKLATHVARTNLAHVVGKRIQASFPISVQSSDPEKAAEKHRQMAQSGSNSPIKDATIIFTDKQSDVKFSSVAYNGADFDAFMRTSLTAFCASLGYPWQFVLHQLTEANLAASQAALDQADKTTGVYQDGFIAKVVAPIDASILREAFARDLHQYADSVDALLVSTYDRPRRPDANRQRTREAAKLAIEMGVSKSTVFAEMGYVYADEVQRTKQDADLAAEILGDAVGASADAETPADEAAADEESDTPTDVGENDAPVSPYTSDQIQSQNIP